MDHDHPGRTSRRRWLGTLAVVGSGLLATTPVGAAGPPVLRPWPAGRPAPPLALYAIDGRHWRLQSLRGRPVLINFWATWCEPCRAEMRSLEALATRQQRGGLAVISVNYRESVPTIRRFLELVPMSLPILLDVDGDAASAWTPRVFPSTVLVDRTGTPRLTVVGELDWDGPEAAGLIEPLLR